MAILANMVGGLVAFQIAGHGVWQRATATGLDSEPSSVFPQESPTNIPIWELQKDARTQEEGTRLVSWLYEFRDFQAVASFLRQNAKLIPLLIELYGQARLRFGPKSALALELFTDPEADSDQGLVAIIRAHLTPEQAQKLMDDFDMEWWLDALPRAEHKLTIVIEYA